MTGAAATDTVRVLVPAGVRVPIARAPRVTTASAAAARIPQRFALRDGAFAFLGAPEAMRVSDEPYTRAFLAAA